MARIGLHVGPFFISTSLSGKPGTRASQDISKGWLLLLVLPILGWIGMAFGGWVVLILLAIPAALILLLVMFFVIAINTPDAPVVAAEPEPEHPTITRMRLAREKQEAELKRIRG